MPVEDKNNDTLAEAIAGLRSALVAAGKMGDDGDDEQALKVATALVSGFDKKDDEEEEVMSAMKADVKALAETFGLKASATLTDIKAHAAKLHVQQIDPAEYRAMKDQLSQLSQEKRAREAKVLVKSYIDDGKINPNSEKSLAWANKMALKDPKAFAELMDDAPKLFDTDQHVNAPSRVSDGKRDKIIREAVKAHKENPHLFGGHPLKATINSYLSMDDENQKPITDAELTALKEVMV